MKNFFISVIIPVYERFELFYEAFNSVLNQTYRDFEIIIVDDGSKDRRIEWLSNTFGATYIKTKHTGFPGLLRNIGFEHSRGTHIAFLDSDDLWNIHKLNEQVKFLKENPELKIVHTKEIWLRDSKIISQKKQKHKKEGYIFEDALKKCIIGPSTVLIESSLFYEFGGFRDDLEIAEDYELWLRITSKYPVGYIEKPLVIKRAGNWQQLSLKYGQIEIFRIYALKPLVEKKYFPQEKHELAKKELLRKIKIYINGLKKRGNFKEAQKWKSYLEENF